MLCQFWASATFQLFVLRKHWLCDLLVQVAYLTNFGKSCFPGSNLIQFSSKYFDSIVAIESCTLHMYFGQSLDPENNLPDPIGCFVLKGGFLQKSAVLCLTHLLL